LQAAAAMAAAQQQSGFQQRQQQRPATSNQQLRSNSSYKGQFPAIGGVVGGREALNMDG